MKKTLEHIQQHISEAFKNEKPFTRFNISEKYMGLFNDYVYDVSVKGGKQQLPSIIEQLAKPLFIYNSGQTELIIVSPVFALLFGINQKTDANQITNNEWFKREFWSPKIKSVAASEALLFSYETANGNIPEFMAQLKVNGDNNLEIHVLRCPFKIAMQTDGQFFVSEVPMIFELGHSEPIHLVRFLMAPKPL